MSKDDIRAAKIEREGTTEAAKTGSLGIIIAAVLGALITNPITYIVTKAQLRVACDTRNLESLEKDVEKLQTLRGKMAAVTVDAPQTNYDVSILLSKFTDRYTTQVEAARPYYRYLPKELCSELDKLRDEITQCIFEAKAGIFIDQQRGKRVYEQMRVLERQLDTAITDKLRSMQLEIEHIRLQ